ncbi:MAG TPA: hypothetical protein VH482_14445 [Thermomicrobiales bacterium]|jgi:Ca2+-binding RTX toxin-like protein
MNRLKNLVLVSGLVLATGALFGFSSPHAAGAQAVPLCNGLVPTIVGAGFIPGTAGNDVILGSPNPDTIDGRGGNDVICALGGDDMVDGGAGNDTVFAGQGKDWVRGGDGNDTLFGNDNDDNLQGGAGDDYLNGGAHNFGDVCNGNAGLNTLVACNP